ncbi:uncharacterized protein LOC132265122 isoform X2 [Phlebotomus argentipes]|uniref:uncharacterized protein LOC132265122 isoform X2 n=1 Tax=Phlebotomus argentipes TaxID=94469 RepID=UPI002892B60B|nr:uncharacterized protein LOC132265122 isoform X2 [Phlebotomus argentipes]
MVVSSHFGAQRKCNCFDHYSDAEFSFSSISEGESINITNAATSTQHTRSALGHTISKIRSTQFSSNIKNKGYDRQMLYQQQPFPAMSPDPWGEVLSDCPAMEGPESPGSSMSSPLMPLDTSFDYETYSLCVDGEEIALPLSQKEDSMCLANAHLQISSPQKSPSDHSYSMSDAMKLMEESCDEYDDGFSTTDNRVLYRDTMISDASKVISFIDEDTNLETVNYNEIMIKKEAVDPVDDYSLEAKKSIESATYMNNMQACQSVKQLNEPVNRISELSTVAEDLNLWKPIEKVDFVKPEDKTIITFEEAEVLTYKYVEKKVEDSLQIDKAVKKGPSTRFSIKKEEEQEITKKKRSNRMRHHMNELPKLNLGGIPAQVKSVLDYEQKQQLNTPDIIEETLNMEEETFDLIDFICRQDLQSELVATPVPSPKSPEEPSPESPAADVSPSAAVPASATSMPKRKRLSVSLYENPSSVQSCQSSVDEPAPKKKRGRPPKTHSSPPSPSQLKGLTEQDLRYWEMRNKNNEASRRSRLHKKQKEMSLEQEADSLVRHHQYLLERQKRLQRKVTLLEIKLKEAIQ